MNLWGAIHERGSMIAGVAIATFGFQFGVYWGRPDLPSPLVDFVMAPPATVTHAEFVADGTMLVGLIGFALFAFATRKVGGGDSA